MFRAIAPHDIDKHSAVRVVELARRHRALRPTAIEIRVLDTQEHPGADLAIAELVVSTVERLYRGAERRSTRPMRSTPMRSRTSCANASSTAKLRASTTPDYLRVLGDPKGRRPPAKLARARAMAQRKLAPHRAALDVILSDGTLSTRLKRSVGPNVTALRYRALIGSLCDCLAEGRMFHAGG